MLLRVAPAFALAVSVAAAAFGCGDLFHGTNWDSRCDHDPSSKGCDTTGSGGHTTSGSHAGAGPTTSTAGGGGATSTSGSQSTSTASSSAQASTGSGGASPAGCADGTREGFTSLATHPAIAGCSGGFSVPGLATPPNCGRGSGNDSPNPTGVGCSAGDLCAVGWHVCATTSDVTAHSSNGCLDAATDPNLFFAVQESGMGSAMCQLTGSNDIFGCGSIGTAPDPITCTPLDRFSGDLCGALGTPWNCGTDNVSEAINVTKSGPGGGGVICCAD
jgi:hypothetical protein